ncbi:MAG: hypothetical protein PHI70_04525 [Proteiniphilum sp.]|nr:hypothetical protein [Proteiniphilum sp.]MDD3908732.1 hypothetical protein [Proteiniphilum sp.]MDD4416032.1 hypothetical protein [Proteiniphilum sp.]
MEILVLYIIIPGRIISLQMGRYGISCEQRFRQNFSKDFDWLYFNLSLSERILSGDRKVITIDSSYISKSGKCTPWIVYFWSGIKPNRRLNDKLVKEFVEFEAIAA